ncbi:hypothetical protein [Kamptonema sp. UHCC 0994]|nr:hypothetical protein [Kamptonema sp. UHCC 0994]
MKAASMTNSLDPDTASLTLRLKVQSLLNQSLPMTTMTNAER